MTDEERRPIEGVHIEGKVTAGFSGDQSIVVAGREIEVEDAAHRREMERQRVERELAKDKRAEDEKYLDRKHQRWRDNCTYVIVALLIVGGLIGSFLVAILSDDPTQQIWAQGLTTSIAGAAGGAFAGYLIASKR